MPERVAESIEEIARPNRDDQQESRRSRPTLPLRRPRRIRNTPAAIPRCNTPRPWPPYLVAKEQDDGQDG
jgi:hypothetical protein